MKKLIAFALLISITSLISCKKEKIKGCTTSYATNYNSTAEDDDGSCQYEGSMVFWQKTPQLGSIDIYLDGVFTGNSNVAFSSAPACGNGAALTVKKNIGYNKSKSYKLTASVDGGSIFDAGTVTFEANTCTSLQLN
jgi:hypothetical protein